MRLLHLGSTLAVLALLLGADQAAARVAGADVQRSAAATVLVSWTARGPVDVYLADRPDQAPSAARLVSRQDRDGHAQITVDAVARPYVLLRDDTDGSVVEVSERLVPLEQGSNFRDVGGYATADGRHVRWGRIYRSGATPLLTEADKARVAALGLTNMVDLRSSEERQIAPSRIEGVPYEAVGYSMAGISDRMRATGGNGIALYRDFPKMLAPQLRLLFADLERNQGATVYNCSAGQDRTGFATAMVLWALGVPRETIVRDYHLSTQYRRPEFELPKIDPATYPGNPVAQMLAQGQDKRAAYRPAPLLTKDGRPYLDGAFAQIEEQYGSVENYLAREIGVGPGQIAALRKDYLE